jgi:threonine aldolase
MNPGIVHFASDYMEGAHPKIMRRLAETNLEKTAGYGTDGYCAMAGDKIRAACDCPEAAIHFFVGGTQTNATVIDGLLKSYQGVIAASTGHISVHEAGAIEFGGHKVLALRGENGKLASESIDSYLKDFHGDGNRDHMVQPGMVYISQPTEYGTLYSLEELTAINGVCRDHKIPLYVDGARLAYALACRENDATLSDLARLCDAFYIGGTKCGALFGEAVVIPNPGLIPHFLTIIKQHGALFAKGRILGLQFDTLFTDGLYSRIGKPAIDAADKIRAALEKAGYAQHFRSPTNQIFVVLENNQCEEFATKIESSFWEKKSDTHTVMRLATSWATTEEEADDLIAALSSLRAKA